MNKFPTSMRSTLVAAAFLMATSAIGPGFLTQTAVFTGKLSASFGFVIMVSILLDIGAQLNIWRIVSVSGLRAQQIANRVLPGMGHALTAMIAIGGFAFNIGNLAGAGLGLNALTGMPVNWGAALSAGLAVAVFLSRDALARMDTVAKALGMLMLALTVYVVFSSKPPVALAIEKTWLPDRIDGQAILTLVGGTVGGYISFAGAHRLLESGLAGRENLRAVSGSAVSAIVLASVMRVLLFLAALGVFSQGIAMEEGNPAAGVFRAAAGQTGYLIFGFVMWSAAITSVIGSAFTSVSFLKTVHPGLDDRGRDITVAFIVLSAAVFLAVGQPVKTLVAVGTLNGFILPFSLGTMLLALGREDIMLGYRNPRWMTAAGVLVTVATLWMGLTTLWRMVQG
jgi:Mn2+/Fe2+ NRAMP family transporter